MGVTISKPAINIREKLTEASAVVPYEQRQFHFDGLVTNGTFDTDVSGWSSSGSTLAVSSGKLRITNTSSYGLAYQSMPVEVGRTYTVTVTGIAGTAPARPRAGYSAGDNTIWQGSTTSSGEQTETFTFTSTGQTLFITLYAQSTTVGQFAEYDNISVYEIDPSDNKVIHTMPKGWKPLHVYEDGALQREGSAYDYTVEYDGFNYIVKETVAPVAPYSTTVIGVRA